ncbi:hypothetical protein [Pseudoalteromonas carrageenovora]|uniref:Sel1 repeat family protein n=1 Tax=Pseudoalteromonas carrageenovora IAM 12662 TaxID=1314868 RepID=A0A2K4XEI6_PSEVC|nr:hypothetical protein [Pseudoalteromonas carrageenovora]MBE0384354.1 hypothetical protein [Pseudoalteromonas carrageenovora IAM 12662]MDO6463127.1 hypothetical protein [Pseudoalteromonas carrageenovora]QBJ73804.1 hypothetical protein PC2016_3632 [Pseudoalteromonas carrageenovora]SOU42739.1 conserved exported protein of unknown function [Pseudoalteromonas carrageenovora IAM 12662]GEB71413.1 hypothetical protein PCA01_21230 [Pseudoalteromonas carrageenovora]
MDKILLLLIMMAPSIYAAGPRWDNTIGINDPDLTVITAAQQCHKSLINAPEYLEEWCEKAYSMGYWKALITLSLHTGDGTRLLEEAKKRVAAKEIEAYSTLAWLYGSGMFVGQDIDNAISLHKEFLALDTELPNSLVTTAHFELASLYKSQHNWLAVKEHAQYVIEHSALAYDKEQAVSLLQLANEKAQLKINY